MSKFIDESNRDTLPLEKHPWEMCPLMSPAAPSPALPACMGLPGGGLGPPVVDGDFLWIYIVLTASFQAISTPHSQHIGNLCFLPFFTVIQFCKQKGLVRMI